MFIPTYLRRITGENPFAAYYLKGRPVWGPHLCTLSAYAELQRKISQDLEKIQADGGLLILPFSEEAERSLLLFLSSFSGLLLLQKTSFCFSQFLNEPYLEIPSNGVTVWLIHHAPKYQNLDLVLESWVKPGCVVLATGLAEMWEQPMVKLPTVHCNFFLELSPQAGSPDRDESEVDQQTVERTDLPGALHRWVVLGDAWGVPLPFELLARLVHQDEDDLAPLIERAYQEGSLFWVEREKPAALLVATRSERFARHCLQEFSRNQQLSLEDYRQILALIDPAEREERFTILKIIQSWIVNSRFRCSLGDFFRLQQIRQWVIQEWDNLKVICMAGNASELLVWTQCLQRLQLFSQGEELVKTALDRFPQNDFLIQARAHLLSQWSQIDPRQQGTAEEAFAEAERQAGDNPHIWQSQGVFEAQRRNPLRARQCFARALELDPQNIYSLVARADLYLNEGLWGKAGQDLEKAQEHDPQNLFARHLMGRRNFYLGEWSQAEKAWQEMLKIDPYNIYARQSLGNLRRERGHWQPAEEILSQALKYDPENVPILHELVLLLQEREEVTDLLLAEKYLTQAMQLEPENPQIIVTSASLKFRQLQAGIPINLDTTVNLLEGILILWPQNFYALHVLGRCYYALGHKSKMVQCFRKIVDQTKGSNLPVYLIWAELEYKDGNPNQAKELLQRGVNIYYDSSDYLPVHKKIEALLIIARLTDKMGTIEEVKEIINAARDLDRDYANNFKIQLACSALGI